MYEKQIIQSMKKEMAAKYDVFGVENSLERSKEGFSVIIVADKANEVWVTIFNS